MHWKDKLERLSSLPDEYLDKDVLWNQLNGRINKKRFGGKLLNGLIAITGGLLLITGLVWISSDRKAIATSSYTIYKPGDTKKPVYIESVFPKEKLGLNKNKKKQVINNVDGNTMVEKIGISEPTPSTEETETINNETPKEKDNISSTIPTDSTVASINPQKKLRVVHINEVGKPVIENIKIARASQSINDRFTNKAAPAYFSNNSDDNIFKINLFPHN